MGIIHRYRDQMKTTLTAYETRAATIWRLVHDEGHPIKKASNTLKISLSEAYEMLAYWNSRRDVAERRRAAIISLKSMGQVTK